ncbi:MAG: hypothetical protein KC731_42495, partial [Myxococcales bacterium]|nr:hypothetical protein [Myxococcales bacterium]
DEFALLADNHWFLKNPSSNQWCSFGVTTTTPPVEVDLVKCGESSSWRLLLEGRLYGGDGCFVN